MYKGKERSKSSKLAVGAKQSLFVQRPRTKELSKSLGDLSNFKREIYEKLNGKLTKPSPRSLRPRRLGETNVSLETDDIGTSLATRDCCCVLKTEIKREHINLDSKPAPPPSRDEQRLRDIARENSNSASFNTMRQRTLKVNDIVHTASKLEAEYLRRAKSPAYSRNFTKRTLNGYRCVCEGSSCTERVKPSCRLKKQALIVKIPGLSDNLNDYNCKGGWDTKSNFSYRHKKYT